MFNRIVFFKFKIGLSLFSCEEKYTEQSTHCALMLSCVNTTEVILSDKRDTSAEFLLYYRSDPE